MADLRGRDYICIYSATYTYIIYIDAEIAQVFFSFIVRKKKTSMHILYAKYIVICVDLFVNTTVSVLSKESDDVMISSDPFKIVSLVIWIADE